MVYVHIVNAYDILREGAKSIYQGKQFGDGKGNTYEFSSFPIERDLVLARNIKSGALEQLSTQQWFGLHLIAKEKRKP